MGPQPRVYPGPGWHANFEEVAIHHVFQIPSEDPRRYEIAPYVMIDWDSMSPELLGTRGCGCPVHAKHLHARVDKFPCPAFDRWQEHFFAAHQMHSEGVDWAVIQEGDITLCAEIIRHHTATAQSPGVRSRSRTCENSLQTTASSSTNRPIASPGQTPIIASIATSPTPSPQPHPHSPCSISAVSKKPSIVHGIGLVTSQATNASGASMRGIQSQIVPCCTSVISAVLGATLRKIVSSLTHTA